MTSILRAKITLCFLLFFLATQLHAQEKLYFNLNAIPVHIPKLISELRLSAASELLQKERLRSPDNTAIDYLEDYIDFFSMISTQDGDLLKKLLPNKNRRLDRIKKCHSNSPYTRYAQAEIHLHWAFCQLLQHEIVSSALAFKAAYNLLDENASLFPDFALNAKDLGMLKAMVGTIPDSYSWVLNLIGMKGNYSAGVRELENFILSHKNQKELLLEIQTGTYYYIILQLNFGNKNACWQFCEAHTQDYQSNLLSTYLRSYTALKTGNSNESINVIRNKPVGKDLAPFPVLDYVMGIALQNTLDDDALIYFKKYVSFSKGKNLIKDSYRRMAWSSLLLNNMSDYYTYKEMAITYGVAYSDEDKSALRECKQEEVPQVSLLRCRLLYDGGNYNNALALLLSHDVNSYSTIEHRLEYHYRLGRIYAELKQYNEAIKQFDWVINNSQHVNLYFAPMSCLQLGVIYENQGKKNTAITYYSKVQQYKNYEYRNGISQKANAALSRLKP